MNFSRGALRLDEFQEFRTNFPFDARRSTPPHGDFLYMLRGDPETPTYSGVEAAIASRLQELDPNPCKITGGLQRHCESENSSRFHRLSREISVARKIVGGVADRIRELRVSLGMNQTTFARRLGTRPSTVSKWESGHNRPVPDVFVKMAKLAQGPEKLYFLDLAGVPDAYFEGAPMTGEMLHAATQIIARATGEGNNPLDAFSGDIRFVTVPLIGDARKVGTKDAVAHIAQILPFPPEWIPESGNIQAARFSNPGVSMIAGDLIALIDINRRDADRLVDCAVAVRTEDGLEAMMLRRDGANYLLMPFQPNRAGQLLRDGDRSIIGRIVKWIADAPSSIQMSTKAPKTRASRARKRGARDVSTNPSAPARK